MLYPYLACVSLSFLSCFYWYIVSPFLFLLGILTGADKVVDSRYDFSVVDSNSLAFLFKHSPEASKMLDINSEFSFNSNYHSDGSTWIVSELALQASASHTNDFN